ncbi:AfsR/SARP family transcriptional regulator [Dactylosporangium matsuzakiense]|uniref:OmpR/PhoB-type domain-containing protein n=1 Tax=Dactylosporangium matsuzakiense TaxID=53360 RepID=A0A9W6NN18_9ACTN|nr:AfsR/SARP family transcriptional regulator [Dactylosporangium matsuzakiense]UWZ40881.1 winged helix-turn-helix domain-containing protein [Dactylosporangium matsuzakiense]GLL03490.1 hypothetical protein GCM10017581_052360 [Dactylosporangium matsuzakiense]
MSDARFAILGPLEVSAAAITSPKQRVVLATLLLSANQVVDVDDLIERVWEDDEGPHRRRSALQVHVARLRKTLEVAGTGAAICTHAHGYEIEMPDDQLDLTRFAALRHRAGRARDAGEPGEESTLLQEALALWRGRPLLDVESESLRRDHMPWLNEQWLGTVERHIDLELQLGRAQEVIPAIRAAIAGHPLRESLWCQLMLACHQCGRRVEAVDAYHSLRQTLSDQLGVAPGARAAAIFQRILQDQGPPRTTATVTAPPPPAPAHRWSMVCQLPPDRPDFAGRTAALEHLEGVLTGGGMPVAMVLGLPGVGKTALAVHLAHRLRHHFPDGQWYVGLTNDQCRTRELRTVLGELIRASGADTDGGCDTIESMAAFLRGRLADRRVLLLLDDAVDADQVSHLLPGTSGSAVLLTSRFYQPTLVARHSAVPYRLDELGTDESLTLLARLLGAGRVEAEPDAAADLVQLCGHLPLALQLAAAALLYRPHRQIADYVAELRSGNRLSELSAGHGRRTALRHAFDGSYASLSTRARRLFRHLGAAHAEFTGSAPAVQPDMADALDELVAAHLVEEHKPGRFRVPKLLHLYAAERAAETTQPRFSLVPRTV